MLAFEIIGLVMLALFFGAMINPSADRSANPPSQSVFAAQRVAP